jgi:hypothetical protein
VTGRSRRCTVCQHPERGRIDYLLCVAEGNHGSGRRALGEKYGLSQHAIWRHGKAHISEEYRKAARVGPFQSEEELRRLVAESGASALDRFNALYNGHLSRWLHALEIGDDDAMTRHGALMGQLLAKIGVIQGIDAVVGPHLDHQQSHVVARLLRLPATCRGGAAAVPGGVGGLAAGIPAIARTKADRGW